MSRPTDHQIRELVKKIRRNDLAADQPDWKKLTRQLVDALRHDTAGTNTADGWPAGTLGGGNGPSIKVEADEHGDTERISVTSVEAAAIARMSGQHDQMRTHLEHAVGFLDEAARAVGAFTNRMALIESILGSAPNTSKVCDSHARIRGDKTTPEHYGTVGGRLIKPADLCGPCYDFVRTTGRIPTLDEVTDHAARGRFRIRSVS